MRQAGESATDSTARTENSTRHSRFTEYVAYYSIPKTNRTLPASAPGTRLIQVPNLSAARAFAFAASSSRFLDSAFVSSEPRRRAEIPAISSTAAMNEASFAFDGLLKPLIFLTNCSDAARTSSAVTGGSKLKRILIFLHIRYDLKILKTLKPAPTKNINRLSDSREARLPFAAVRL